MKVARAMTVIRKNMIRCERRMQWYQAWLATEFRVGLLAIAELDIIEVSEKVWPPLGTVPRHGLHRSAWTWLTLFV